MRSRFLTGWCTALILFLAGCGSSAPTAQTAGPVVRDTSVVTTGTVPVTVPVRVPEAAYAGVNLDTVRAGRFDSGKMWTFDNPPIAYLQETYGFTPDTEWFEHARLGALRIPGCSASFVSPNGLLLTNHHCSRGYTTALSREGEDLLDEGFYAASLDEERRAEAMYADQLIRIDDVTDEVYAAVEGLETDAERAAARQEAIQRIEERLQQEGSAGGENIHVEVISLYNGGQYSAYVFRRYEDVRLVLMPELQLGYYGGDPDNFTYPRYALDMTLWRVYEDGAPLDTEDHYFRWSETGAQPGEAVFVIGNPGSTSRLQTVAQLEFRRDVQERALVDVINQRVEALQAYVDQNPEVAEELGLRNALFSLLNAQKAYAGMLEGLRDPVILARRADTERQFIEAVQQDPALRAEYGDLVEQMANLQEQKREYAEDFEAFLGLNPGSTLGSAVLQRAVLAYLLVNQQAAGAGDEQLANLRQQLLAIDDQPRELQEAYLAQRLSTFQRIFGAESEMVQAMLDGRTPEEAAAFITNNSMLVEADRLAEAVEQGTLTRDDPALQLVEAFIPRYQAYQSAFGGLMARQQELASRIGRAKFAVYGTDLPPDATFSLRIADGIVAGYPYNGTIAPPHTTYYGLYDHYYSYGPDTPWDLPERWLTPPETFDLSTPINLVSTNDIIGGNSGSPLLDRDLELVGLVFDGNIESLPGNFIYQTDRARTVSVDARGILEAIDDIYEADRIVQELRTGALVASEEDVEE